MNINEQLIIFIIGAKTLGQSNSFPLLCKKKIKEEGKPVKIKKRFC